MILYCFTFLTAGNGTSTSNKANKKQKDHKGRALADVLLCPLNNLLLACELLDSRQECFLLAFLLFWFFFNSVKLSIKSFKVPELYVEVPETATFGSLKVYNYLK